MRRSSDGAGARSGAGASAGARASADASSGDEHLRYLQDRIKQLEGINIRLKERLAGIEQESRSFDDMRIQYEEEIQKLQSELEKLQAPPLLIGTAVEVIDDKRMVVVSSTGPRFVVNYSQRLVERKNLSAGTQVGLDQQSLAVVAVLPSAKDPAVSSMEVIESPDANYEMIGGLKYQMEEITEAVELPLTEPERFKRIGVVPPKGVLLIGEPGTGKTLLVKAVANRTSATFIRVVGSELVQKYIGEGARMVRELFELAKEKAPSILFIDEIDAIAARREEDGTSGEREVQRTMMQLFAEIDGFDRRGDVRIIGATNRPNILDPALIRPGRFDRIIQVPAPDKAGRKEIFRIHTSAMTVKSEIDLANLAALTEGATGADIKAIAVEAGMLAARNSKKAIGMEEFERAIDKVKKSKQLDYLNANTEEPGVMFV